MTKIEEPLTFEIRQFASELKRLEQRLRSEAAPDAIALNEFRHAVDNVRLTAWSVSEIINAERIKKDPNMVLAFLSAERLRRFEHLVKNLCGDIARGLIDVQADGMHSLRDSVNTLQQQLVEGPRSRPQRCKLKDAAS